MFLNRLFDVFSFTLSPVGRYAFIVLLSLICAVLFLLIFKKTSNQKKITYHKNKIFGHILQIPLYQDQFGLLFSNLVQIVKHNLLYILYTLFSLIFMLIPLAVVTVQIDNRCGYAPLVNGQNLLIRVTLDKAVERSTLENLYCEPPTGVSLETPALRMEDEKQVLWRAKVGETSNEENLSLRCGVDGNALVIEKYLVTAYNKRRFRPEKKIQTLWNSIVYNAEGYLPAGTPVIAISTDYPRAMYPFLFWRIDAILLFFIVTLIFGFALKGVFKVTI